MDDALQEMFDAIGNVDRSRNMILSQITDLGLAEVSLANLNTVFGDKVLMTESGLVIGVTGIGHDVIKPDLVTSYTLKLVDDYHNVIPAIGGKGVIVIGDYSSIKRVSGNIVLPHASKTVSDPMCIFNIAIALENNWYLRSMGNMLGRLVTGGKMVVVNNQEAAILKLKNRLAQE